MPLPTTRNRQVRAAGGEGSIQGARPLPWAVSPSPEEALVSPSSPVEVTCSPRGRKVGDGSGELT